MEKKQNESLSDLEVRINQAELRAHQAEARTEVAEQSERRLRASELSYRRLFEAARDGILILDAATGRITDANPFLVELLGYPHAEMVGKTVGELSPFKDVLSNQAMLERLQTDGYIRYEDLPLETKDGRKIEVEFVSNVYQAGQEKVIQCNIRDITEHKLSKNALRESEEKFRSLFTATATGMAISTPEGRFLQANAAYCQMLGYTEAELRTRDFASLTHPDDLALNLKMRDEMLAGQRQSFVMEKRYLKKTGEIVWTRHSVSAVRAPGGQITRLIAVAEDITERKRAEQVLRKQQAELQVLFDLTPAMLCFKDTKNNFLQVNQRLAEAAGRPIAEIEGKPVAEIFPVDAEKYYADDLEVMQSGKAKLGIIETLQTWDGKNLWVQTDKVPVSDPDGKVAGLVVMVQDVTERKRAEEALVLFRTLIDQSNDSIEVVDSATYRYLDVNESACTTHGYTRKEMLSMSVGDIDPNFGPALQEQLETGLRKDGRMTFESSHRRKDGTTFPVEVTLKLVQLDKHYTVAVVRDITERKRTEARFRRLVDSNVQGVFFWNTKGQITEANDAFLHLTGYNRQDLSGGTIDWVAMTPPEYAEHDEQARKELAAAGVCTPYEKEYIRKDGKRVPILLGVAEFKDNSEEGVGFVLDLTERKKLEQQFRQSQKMESFGQLAGGVAHDFNNILAVIQMQVDLFKDDGRLTPEQLDCVGMISKSTERATALTKQLLLFSRKEAMQPRDLDLSQSINGITNMLRRILGEHIQIQFKFAMQPLYLYADPGMLDQVLLNLAVNSRDAMPKGGRLIIETTSVEFDKTVSSQFAQARAGSFVCLAVSDTGCGIPPENLSRIFEPFFTTKEVGKGTGLGLATVFGIVQQHKGWINVYSEVGRGTTFRIYLPRLLKPAVTSKKAESPKLTALPGGDETILLVEDDDFVRPAICNALSRLGYRVFAVNNGVKALEIWQLRHDQIDLLLTDLVMPGGVNGKDLGERLLRENPKLKVIYTSGYSAEIVDKNFRLEEGVNFITKPFQAESLARTIRDRLDKKT